MNVKASPRHFPPDYLQLITKAFPLPDCPWHRHFLYIQVTVQSSFSKSKPVLTRMPYCHARCPRFGCCLEFAKDKVDAAKMTSAFRNLFTKFQEKTHFLIWRRRGTVRLANGSVAIVQAFTVVRIFRYLNINSSNSRVNPGQTSGIELNFLKKWCSREEREFLRGAGDAGSVDLAEIHTVSYSSYSFIFA